MTQLAELVPPQQGIVVTWQPYLTDAPTMSEAALARSEQRIGASLSQDCRATVIQHAGHVPEPGSMPIDKKRKTSFGPLLTSVEDEGHRPYSYSVQNCLDTIADWGEREPDGKPAFFPFADSFGAGLSALDLRGGDANPPTVFIDFNHKPDEPGRVRPLAAAFTETLERLQP